MAAKLGALFAALVIGSVSALGCGGGGGSSTRVIATVAGIATIDNATLSHWMPIEARIIYSEQPTGPAPAGVMPDPPAYSACIAFLRAYLKGTYQQIHSVAGVGGESSVELKRKCARHYTELKAITLNTLIGWYWIIGQGREAGFSASGRQVRDRLASVNKRLFRTSADFANYLRWTAETLKDMTFRSRVQLFEAKIRARTLAAAKAALAIPDVKKRQLALAKLSTELSPAQRWVQRTKCASAYVVSSCKEYKGALAPGFPD